MKKSRKQNHASVWGYIIFFLTISVVVTIALSVFVMVNRTSGGDQGLITATMFLVIVFISGACTIADAIRRKIMVEKPVDLILSATERIAAGDFSVRLQPRHEYSSYDEFDCIMENINVMAGELSKSEVLKSDFVSNVSHELKTPLAVIQSYASMLQKKDLDEETRSKYVQTMLLAVKRLHGLVQNILKLNKLENQELTVEKQPIRLHEILAEQILSFENLLEEKNIALECDLDEVEIVSSPTYLEIVWNNLLSNAVKFTHEGGTISVSLKKAGENVVVKVTDTGCGISPEVGARIFDKFYQGDTSHAQEGNGLGLALVKKVIDILGGEITVSSELGKGSTFTIILKA